MSMTAGAWIWMAIWIAALLAMVWLLVSGDGSAGGETAADILRRRYAAGEINEDEFRHARDVLGESR